MLSVGVQEPHGQAGLKLELAMRGSNGVGKGALKGVPSPVVHFDQEKLVLGDTCSRLAYAKQSVASSNINIYHRKSVFFCPDGF